MHVWCRIVSLALLLSAGARGAQLSALDQALTAGQAIVTPLSLNSSGQPIAAVQFDMQWDAGLGLHVIAGDQLRQASKVLYSAPVGPQTIRCLVVGINQISIADGDLLRIFVSANSAAAVGAAQIRITNAVAASPNGTAIPLDAAPINVQILDGASAQSLPQEAVLNAASMSPGPLSPGEMITIFGFDALPNASLKINDTQAPILYVDDSQINAIVPFGLDVTSPANVEVSNEQQVARTTVPVAPITPAIFTTTSTGLGPGKITNEDGSENSFDNPASPGSVVAVYGTGFGVLQQPVTDGQVTGDENPTAMPVVAAVAGFPADVIYAGATPGNMAGLIQIRLRLPAQLMHNSIAPVQLNIAGADTPQGVTVAVQ